MYVVTGGAGFIGSNLIAELEDHGLGPIGLCDHFGHEEKWRNVAKRELDAFFEPEECPGALDELHGRSPIRAVLHMGAISSTTETDVDRLVERNIRFSMRIWEWCTANTVPLIYASSAATYGDGAHGFDDDPGLMAGLRPLNAYGWSKWVFDRWALRRVEAGSAPPQWVGLKFFNVYGPNEYHKGSMQSVAAHAYRQIAAGEPVTLFRSHHPDYPDGGQTRDFVSVEDCAAVVRWLLEHPDVSGIYNLGTGRARTFRDLVGAVFAALEKDEEIRWVDTPEAIRDRYQYFTEASMDRIRDAGYTAPFLDVEEGVARYVRDYLDRDDPYR